MEAIKGFVEGVILGILFTISLWIGTRVDLPIEKAILAQEICIKANSKAVSFDSIEVTCENKAVIPLKGD